jgi:ArsR family transcriptional regulator
MLKLLADDTRWRLVGALRHSDRQAVELATELNLPQNLLSYHLGLLRQAGLVQAHRSDADARATYYGLDLAALRRAHQRLGLSLALPGGAASALPSEPVVFLCTHNSARSQMAEGWLRTLSAGHVPSRSAGTHPGRLHPLAVEAMREVGVDIGYQHSKGMETLAGIEARVAVTVCDLAREECNPVAFSPLQLHWSIADPAQVQGSRAEQLAAFRATRDQLRTRVEGLLAALPTLRQQTDA